MDCFSCFRLSIKNFKKKKKTKKTKKKKKKKKKKRELIDCLPASDEFYSYMLDREKLMGMIAGP